MTAVLMLLSIPALCQYSEIVTTDDGQQVYFTTQLVERSAPADASVESRVFRIDGRTVQLFAERGDLARSDMSGSNDGASSLQLTGDGQSVAFVLTNICAPDQSCGTTIQRAEIRGRGATLLGEANRVSLSRNGRWALLAPPPYVVAGDRGNPPILTQNTESTLVKLETGEKTKIGMPATNDGSFVLGSDGSVFQRGQGLPIGVWKEGALRSVPPIYGGVAFLAMSDDASTVLMERIDIPPQFESLTTFPVPDLIVWDVHTGATKVVQNLGIPLRHTPLGISNNGARALFRTISPTGPGPVVLVDTRTLKSAPITLSGNQRAVAGALSGDGNTVILGLSNGRMLRLAIGSNLNVSSTEELIPALPYFDSDFVVAPGALIDVEPPMPGEIDWTGRIQLNKVPLAVVRKSVHGFVLQVPWEMRTGLAAVSIDYSSDSPLAQRTQLLVAEQSPRFSERPEGASGVLGGMLVKGDFSGYVTNSLKPGDIVHMYMTGLGAVRGSVKTGEPAPLNDLRPITGYVHCLFTPHTTDAETLFAGLAPGMIGIYQLTFRMPADVPDQFAPTGLRCGFNTPGYSLIMAPL